MVLGSGDAPTLDYDVPQRSCISALGRIELDIPTGWFLDAVGLEPTTHWWKIPYGDLDEIREGLQKDVAGSHGGTIVERGVADVIRSGEARLAAAQASASQTAATQVGVPRSGRYQGAAIQEKTVDAPLSQASVSQLAGKQTAAVSKKANSRSWAVGVEETAQFIVNGLRPVPLTTLGGAKTLEFVPQPVAPRPRLYLVEEYRVCSYLGDYGAGKTLSTLSLLPGERRTCTLRSYRDSEETRSASENILDSFSQESADELEELIQVESGSSSSSASSQTNTTTGSTGLSVGVDIFGLVEVGVGGDIESSGTKEASTSQEEYVDALDRSLSKHVEQSSYTREVEINTTTSETVSEGEESSVVREFANINHSRVLNFVFRQLLQEYITITYLHSVRVVFTNGYPETVRVMELYSLDEVLPELVEAEHLEEVKAEILKPYCAVFNHRQEPKRFIERVERRIKGCEFIDGEEEKVFYRKDPDLVDEVEGIEVPGVIKRVQRNVLRTPAVVVDSLLGQGESLDCYNQLLQDAAVERAHLDNRVTRTALDIVDSIPKPNLKIGAYTALLKSEPSDVEEEEDEVS